MSAVNRLELQELRVDVDARVKATFRALKQLTEQMAPLPGRKSLVWLSAGVPISDVGLDHQLKDNNPLIRQFAVELNRANIPTYTVDQSPGVGQVGSRDTLEAIASLSGGRYFTSDSTGLAITQAVTDARAAYQIGFYPAAKNRDGKFHKLHVTTVRKGVQIRTRQDYRVDPDATTAQEGFENASVAPFDDPGIGLRVTVSPSPNESKLTRFQIEVDPADLLLASTSASLELGFIDDDGTGRTKAIVTSPFDRVSGERSYRVDQRPRPGARGQESSHRRRRHAHRLGRFAQRLFARGVISWAETARNFASFAPWRGLNLSLARQACCRFLR